MSGTGQRQRTTCSVCANRYRGVPQEVLWHEGRGHGGHWMWLKLDLCPPCKAASHDFWKGSVLQAVAQLATRSSATAAAASMAIATAGTSS